MHLKKLKAQAAIDFMTSYGFAILIIIVAVIIIYKVGFSSVSGFTQHACTPQSGYRCEYINLNTTGILTLKMSQSIATHLRLNSIACSTALNATGTGPLYGYIGMVPSNSFYPANDNPLGTEMYGGASNIFYMNCYDSRGLINGSVSSPFTVYIFLNYTAPGYQPTTQMIMTYGGAYT